ncbi:MAG: hypothetical protein MHPSP_004424, partial [Paramarteilia canceri]
NFYKSPLQSSFHSKTKKLQKDLNLISQIYVQDANCVKERWIKRHMSAVKKVKDMYVLAIQL